MGLLNLGGFQKSQLKPRHCVEEGIVEEVTHLLGGPSHLCYPKCGPWISSTGITLELVRNTNFQVSAWDLLYQTLWEWDPTNYALKKKNPEDLRQSLRNTCSITKVQRLIWQNNIVIKNKYSYMKAKSGQLLTGEDREDQQDGWMAGASLKSFWGLR